ncbi:MAG: hypothetical protein L0G85_04105 [Kocuria sp.]|nr:hypothetical protein [Kocuria sp.]
MVSRLNVGGATSHLATKDLLELIGEQRPQEPTFVRRRRFHQSWYRAEILELPHYGSTEARPARPCGSVLTDSDAKMGNNFTSDAARKLYLQRRTEGWGLEPIRCTKYLTSSQALSLNLFGPLIEDKTWAARSLSLVLGRTDIDVVHHIWIEYAPARRSKFLNDMTRLDAVVLLETNSGEELLAIEVKYADRFSSRRVSIDRAPYRKLATDTELWQDPGEVFATQSVNQLVRCHALAAALSIDWLEQTRQPTLLVLHHREDNNSHLTVDRYKSHLTKANLCQEASLDDFVRALAAASETDEQRSLVSAIHLRYLAEKQSEAAWQAWNSIAVNAHRAT